MKVDSVAEAGQVLSADSLGEAIRFANFAGGTVRIDGEQVREVVLELPWKVVVVLRSGERVVVEPDYFDEIALCREAEWGCYYDNVRLEAYIEAEE